MLGALPLMEKKNNASNVAITYIRLYNLLFIVLIHIRNFFGIKSILRHAQKEY